MPAFNTRPARKIDPAASVGLALREMNSFFWPSGPSVSNSLFKNFEI